MTAARQTAATLQLSAVDWALLDGYQRGFPLESRPFSRIAGEQGVTEDQVLTAYQRLSEAGFISRIGAVVRPHRALGRVHRGAAVMKPVVIAGAGPAGLSAAIRDCELSGPAERAEQVMPCSCYRISIEDRRFASV